MTKNISIIDYDIGNILSVKRSVEMLGFKTLVTNEKDKILNSDKIILPGVGAFKNGMNLLKKHNLIEILREAAERKKSILGICLGMQLFFDESFEFGQTKGLGLIGGKVEKIIIDDNDKSLKIPSIGWNELIVKKKDKILSTIKNKSSTYFVHSYMASPEDKSVTTSVYKFGNKEIVASINLGNIYGCQFHPEKSGKIGLEILNNFILS
jgi:imidazole glycerol-phosphate synthase subunit HisH